MACDAQTLIDAAYANGYAALSDRDLREALVAVACAAGGGGGGGGSPGLVGHGSPEGAVTAVPGVTYLDLDTDNFWVKATGAGNTGWVALILS